MTLDCPMVAELDAWLAEVVQPAALARFGQKVTQIDSMGSYTCRGMNNQPGARLSEHSFGNRSTSAVSVSLTGASSPWCMTGRGATNKRRPFWTFTRRLRSQGVSPGSNVFHYNHVTSIWRCTGVRRAAASRLQALSANDAAPLPNRKDDLPDAPAIDDDLDIAHAAPPSAAPSYAMRAAPDLAAPTQLQRRQAYVQGGQAPDQRALTLHAYAPPKGRRGLSGARLDRSDGAFDPQDEDAPSKIR